LAKKAEKLISNQIEAKLKVTVLLGIGSRFSDNLFVAGVASGALLELGAWATHASTSGSL